VRERKKKCIVRSETKPDELKDKKKLKEQQKKKILVPAVFIYFFFVSVSVFCLLVCFRDTFNKFYPTRTFGILLFFSPFLFLLFSMKLDK